MQTVHLLIDVNEEAHATFEKHFATREIQWLALVGKSTGRSVTVDSIGWNLKTYFELLKDGVRDETALVREEGGAICIVGV